MIRTVYDRLHLAALTPDMHARTCGYWYTMTSRSSPFTAFRTRAALEAFLDLHQLTPAGALPETQGTHASLAVSGRVAWVRHGVPETMPAADAGREVLHLSNGQYTRGVVIATEDGPELHFLNPCPERPVYDHRMAQRLIDAGRHGPLPEPLAAW